MTDIPAESIAIIGMALRFPGASSPAQFWRNLQAGVESITAFSDEELLSEGISPALLKNPFYIKAAGALDDMYMFDASLFSMSPTEAELMDPQHRLFLECAFEGLEQAGYCSDGGKWRIGVFGGVGVNRYLLHNFDRRLLTEEATIKTVTGNDKDYLTTRVSYKLGLTGPSICVQTACSTSLVAVHMACRSLLDYQSDIALAGAVSLRMPQRTGYIFEEGGIVSRDGHCRAFDASAGGTVFGSGVGVVVLKRLEEAIKEGDYIHAVIRGGAVNNDGAMKVGFTAPSIEAQAEVIAEALAVSEVDARDIDYVEAHGTGTALGDPIEIAALTKAFQGWTGDTQFCPIGSVKTNIGHLDTAAGVAGLIKTVLALKHKQIPPSLHFREPNPRIDFEGSPFFVNTTLREWSANGSPRRAGVSSFGLGGTNCHLIIEEAPSIESKSRSTRRFHVVPISAKTDQALRDATSALEDFLSNTDQADIGDVAFTHQVGRKTFPHRRIIISNCAEGAAADIRAGNGRSVFSSVEMSSLRPVAFLFPGQGSQFANMGLELYETEAAFRTNIDAAAEALRDHLDCDLREIIFSGTGEGNPNLNHTSVLQPALFAVEYALAKMWQSWGVIPKAMIGHSLGEYVAASIAGVISFEEAIAVVAQRGKLIGGLPVGAMVSVPMREEELKPLLAEGLSVAAVNAADRTVISGTIEEISRLERTLDEERISYHRLQTSHAFHSSMMDPILEEFRAVVEKVTLRAPKIPFISNVTGGWITDEEAVSPDYWARHIRSTVRFHRGLRTLTEDSEIALLETGPGRILTSLAKYSLNRTGCPKLFTSMPDSKESGEQEEHLHKTLGQLWLAGVPVAWDEFQKDQGRRRLPLPGYAFQRQHYRLDSNAQASDAFSAQQDSGYHRGLELYIPSWQRSLRRSTETEQIRDDEPIRLVLYDRSEIASTVAERLRLNSNRTITACADSEFHKHDETTYRIDTGRQQDYYQLIFSLVADNRAPSEIIHLLNLESSPNAESRDLQVKSFYSLLWLAQALGKYIYNDPVRIAVISSNAQAAPGSKSLEPEKALIAGPCAAMPQEYPNITCLWVDTDLSESAEISADRVLSQLEDELQFDAEDSPIAYRRGQRFLRRFAGLRLSPETGEGIGFREKGVYLITGGFGGIGATIACYLAREARARLILTGRTLLPERTQWETILQQMPDGDEIAKRIRTVLELEEMGAEVLAASADVASEAEMRAVIELAEQRFGNIHGVIHAAGVAGGHLIQTIDTLIAQSVIEPKVAGARVLDKLFRASRLDFFVMCSSLQSIMGGPGQSEYTAANAFLDLFAHYVQFSRLQPCASINWDTWKDTGMAANPSTPETQPDATRSDPVSGLAPEAAVSIFARLTEAAFPQVVVCKGSLHERMRNKTRDIAAAIASVSEAVASAVHPRPDLFTPYVPPSTPMEQTVAAIWQEVLGVDRIGIDDSVFELGGDSVSAIRVSQKLSEKLDVSVPPVRIFAASTVRTLAASLEPTRQLSDLTERQSRGARRRARWSST